MVKAERVKIMRINPISMNTGLTRLTILIHCFAMIRNNGFI